MLNHEKNVYRNQLNLTTENFYNESNILKGFNLIKLEQFNRNRLEWALYETCKELNITSYIDLKNFSRINHEKNNCFRIPNLIINCSAEEYLKNLKLSNGEIVKIIVFSNQKEAGFMIMMHHGYSDSRSMYTIMKLAMELYYGEYAISSFERSRLKLRIAPLTEKINRQKLYLESDKYFRDRNYWENQINNIDFHLTVVNEKSSRITRLLSKKTVDLLLKMNAKGISSNVSVFSLIFSYLKGYLNLNNSYTGFSFDSRMSKEKDAVGMYVNNLFLEYKNGFNPFVLDLLSQTNKNIRKAIKHGKFPVTSEFGIFYDSIISYVNINDYDVDKYKEFWVPPAEIAIPVVVTFKERRNEVVIEFDYQNSLYKSQEIEAFLDTYETYLVHFLKRLITKSAFKMNDVPFIYSDTTMSEIKKISTFDELNLKEIIFNECLTIPKKKIVYQEDEYLFSEINIASNRIAKFLSQIDGDHIIIYGKASIEYITVVLACIKAGKVYIPFSNLSPINRIVQVVNELNAKLICLPDFSIDVLDQDQESSKKLHYQDLLALGKEELLAEEWDRTQTTCCIFYTSGTTGVPKGIPIKFVSIENIISFNEESSVHEESSLFLIADITFDISLHAIFGFLSKGKTLILAEAEKIFSENYLKDKISKYPFGIGLLTPSLVQNVSTDTWDNMDFITIGGEEFPPSLIGDLKTVKKTKIFNAYGPTETTILCSMKKINEITEGSKKISIGKPISNTEFMIIDEYKRELPDYFIGELTIAGLGLMDGYFPNKTNQFFYKNGEKFYKTGDLVYKSSEEYYFVSRIDEQIQLNGYRVEMSDIKFYIDKLIPSKSYALGFVNNELIVFHINQLDVSKIIADLMDVLPVYMVPKRYHLVLRIPITKNQKKDIKKLEKEYLEKEQTLQQKKGSYSFIDALKESLEVLHLYENEGTLTKGFNDISGDSIKAIRLVALLKNNFEIQVSPVEILSNKRIDSLNYLNLKNKKDKQYFSMGKKYPFTKFQELLAVSSLLRPDSKEYLQCMGFSFPQEQIRNTYLEGIIKVLERHAIFNIRIGFDDGEMYQYVQENNEIRIFEYKQFDGELEKIIEPISLTKNAPVCLYKVNKMNGEYILIVQTHHIVTDDQTIANLFSEWRGKVGIEELDFSNYIIEEREYFNSPNYQIDLKNAMEYSKGMKQIRFPTYNPKYGFNIWNDENFPIDSFKKIRSHFSLTTHALFSFVLCIVLSSELKQQKLHFSLPVSMRDSSDLYHTFGPLINTVLVKFEYDKLKTFEENLEKYQQFYLAALASKRVPASELIKKNNLVKDLFSLYIITQDTVDLSLGEQIKNVEIKQDEGHSDLVFQYFDKENRLQVNYKNYPTSFVNKISTSLFELLNCECNELSNKVESIMNEHPKSIVIRENQDCIWLDEKLGIWDYILDAAKLNLNNLCLFESKITYRELIESVNNLSGNLFQKGVKSGDTIVHDYNRNDLGILLQIAIARIGAIYVPINNEFNTEQKTGILNQVQPKFVITEYPCDYEGYHTLDVFSLFEYEQLILDDWNIGCGNNPACIMFSSGTTGTPKGIVISHKNIISMVTVGKSFIKEACSKVLMISNNGFDGSTYDIYRTLFNGGILYVPEENLIRNPESLFNYTLEQSITGLYMSSSYFNIIAETFDLSKWKSVVEIVVGGEKLNSNIINHANKKLLGTITNGYGPTETTCCALSYQIPKQKEIKSSVPLGYANLNLDMIVVDERGLVCERGISGELCISGDGKMLGYLHEKSPLIIYSGKEFYKTGDIVVMDEENKFHFIGRVDRQIKINGYRVILNELEESLNEMELIFESKIIFEDNKLIIYLKSQEDAKLSLNEISKKIPDYLKPYVIRKVTEFQLNNSGKIDLKNTEFEVLE
ncbi:AMP-binding protein [Carnobacterium divergens]|nr:AMP-binding protein [Carnobacterium divergens]